MSDLPTIDDAEDAIKTAQNLVPWLPDPYQCDCGAYCEATTEYVGQQATYMDIWRCPECDTRFFRDRE